MDAAPPLPKLDAMAVGGAACGEELELGDLPRELLLRVMEHLPAPAVVSVPRPCIRLPYRPDLPLTSLRNVSAAGAGVAAVP